MFVATFVGSPSMNMINGVLKNDRFFIEENFSLKMGQEFTEKIKKFYENEILSTEKLLKQWSDKFLSRQTNSQRYLNIFKNNKINLGALKNFINCLDNSALTSLKRLILLK